MQECNEFSIGFCTKDNFYLEEIAKKCDLVHSEISKQKFESANILMGFESEVHKTYKQMIDECDNKIEAYKQIITNTCTPEEESIENVYKKCLSAFKNFSTNRTMYKIMQELRNEMLKQNTRIQICNVCSAFYKEEVCEHFMHEIYKKLRDSNERLRMKIEKLTTKL